MPPPAWGSLSEGDLEVPFGVIEPNGFSETWPENRTRTWYRAEGFSYFPNGMLSCNRGKS